MSSKASMFPKYHRSLLHHETVELIFTASVARPLTTVDLSNLSTLKNTVRDSHRRVRDV